MKFLQESIALESREPIQIVDLTDRVRSFCEKSGIEKGMLSVASQHTTMGVVINEKCAHLEKDMKVFLEKLAPAKGDYAHNRVAADGRPNAHSHLLSLVIPSQVTIVIAGGKPQLGTWQSVFAIELDGPRPSRTIHLTAMGQ